MIGEEMTQMTQEGGNTKPPLCNKKVSCRSRKYCFTLNNYTEKEYTDIMTQYSNDLYIIGKEVGENGTPHLQGYLEFKSARTFDSIKKNIPRAHIEKAKGTTKHNYLYCSKDGDFKSNIKGIVIPKPVNDPLKGRELKPFQKDILDMIKDEPDDRSIYWYWETTGNVGKTSLCKHLCMNHNCLIVNGKQNDMFNAILQWKELKGDYPSIIIIDIPRTSIDYISWTAIEKIKDGLFFSGKYEGGMVVMNSPWVICMANSPPDMSKLSEDRWRITDLNPEEPYDSDLENLE